MALVEEATHVGALVAVERRDARRGEAHDDEMIGDVGEVEVEVEDRVLEASLLALTMRRAMEVIVKSWCL